jgi:hypothetical protein
VVKNTNEEFDGYYASTALSDDDGQSTVLFGPGASSAADASTLRLNKDCSLTALGADTEGFLLNLDLYSVFNGYGAPSFDSPDTVADSSRSVITCSIGADNSLSCSRPGMETFVLCVSKAKQ